MRGIFQDVGIKTTNKRFTLKTGGWLGNVTQW
jgi:hypothetical protein